MGEGLKVFENDFLSYVNSLNLSEDETVSFGDMRFDYDLVIKDNKFYLTVFEVALDHYGMPYRNNLFSERYVLEKQ